MVLPNKSLTKKIIYLFLFSIAFAWVESSVVVYLRVIYYPHGFKFPIKQQYDYMLLIEIIREFATIIMMVTLSALLSKKFWEGFGYFLIVFGIWDIFFYLWLKVMLNWPDSFFTPDILFLIPIPWIGPVLAPVIVSLAMIIIGIDIVRFYYKDMFIKPKLIHWVMVLFGSAIVLYTFLSDTDAAFLQQYPKPYNWVLFSIGILFYLITHYHLRKNALKKNST